MSRDCINNNVIEVTWLKSKIQVKSKLVKKNLHIKMGETSLRQFATTCWKVIIQSARSGENLGVFSPTLKIDFELEPIRHGTLSHEPIFSAWYPLSEIIFCDGTDWLKAFSIRSYFNRAKNLTTSLASHAPHKSLLSEGFLQMMVKYVAFRCGRVISSQRSVWRAQMEWIYSGVWSHVQDRFDALMALDSIN